jgi:hypothetical protein
LNTQDLSRVCFAFSIYVCIHARTNTHKRFMFDPTGSRPVLHCCVMCLCWYTSMLMCTVHVMDNIYSACNHFLTHLIFYLPFSAQKYAQMLPSNLLFFFFSLDPEMSKPTHANKITCIGSFTIVLTLSYSRSTGTKFCLNSSTQHSHNSPDAVSAARTWLTQAALDHRFASTEPSPHNTLTYNHLHSSASKRQDEE